MPDCSRISVFPLFSDSLLDFLPSRDYLLVPAAVRIQGCSGAEGLMIPAVVAVFDEGPRSKLFFPYGKSLVTALEV